MPTTVSSAKAGKLKQQGARLVMHGSDSVEAEYEARRAAGEKEMTYVSPYNDVQVLQGPGLLLTFSFRQGQ